jgi:hypothetical protein
MKSQYFAKRAATQVNKWLDIRMGVLGALSMGIIVYFINSDHGMSLGLIAACKQSIYTFFFGALFVKMAENISINIPSRWIAVVIGGCAPAILTSVLTYLLHTLKGTPEPFHSTVPTMILGTLSFSTWAYLKHRAIRD